VNSGRTPQRIGSHDPFDQPTNLDSGRRSATSSWVHPGQACPELAKALPLPPDDCIGLYVAQRSAPAVPEQRQPDPEEAIEGNQHRSLPFSLEGGELQAESGVLHRNGSMTAHEETNESKDTQKDDWHASRIICLHPVPSQPVTGGRNNGEQHRSKSTTDGWSTDWAGAFGGLSYKTMADRFTQKYAGIRFDLVDLNFDSVVDLPVQGNVLARNNREGIYSIPKTIQQCDRIISVAPLKTHTMTGVSLAIKNYFGIGPGASYGFPKDGLHRLGSPNEVMLDLFSFHPADYAIVGGSWGLEGDGPHAPGARSVHHNVIVAGPNAVAVDAVAASIMGFEAARLPYLTLAEKRGFGVADPDVIWIRGKDVERARKIFRKPSGWDREV
jgi:hypothetical protein